MLQFVKLGLKNQSTSFIAWLCPHLKPFLSLENNYVYFEGDDVNSIYFLKSGTPGYVLPRHMNLMYVRVAKGHLFGLKCILGSFNENDDFDIDKWYSRKDNLKR